MEIKPVELVRQFIVSPSKEYLPDGWHVQHKSDLYLASHPSLPVRKVFAEGGAHIGYLMGWPISPEGIIPQASVTLPVHENDLLSVAPNAEARIEEALYTFGGRWVFALITDKAQRLYLDPCGSQAAVYSPLLQIASATTALIPRTPETDYDGELVRLMDIPNKDRWYPFGITPRRSCRRLLPNHYLDLKSWTAHRHWPTGYLAVKPYTNEAARVVVANIKQLIGATLAMHPVQCSLTAGMDTRVLLACARRYTDRVLFHTREDYSWSTKRDLYVARRIAKRFKLRYEVIRRIVASEADLDAWLERTGHCVAGNARRSTKTIDHFQYDSFTLTGIAGDLARGSYWIEGDTQETVITAPLLIERTPMPFIEQILQAGEDWLAGLPFKDGLLTLDFFGLEQRVGTYHSPSRYGFTGPAVMIYPFAHRAIIEEMLRLPVESKRRAQLHKDIIAQEWPELLEVPINRDMGWRLVKSQALKIFSRQTIGRIKRAVRRRIAARYTEA